MPPRSWAPALLLCAACLLAAGEGLDAPFGGTGLSGLTWNGSPDLLGWPVPRVLKVTTAAGELPLKGGQPGVDAGGRSVTWTWPWGSVAITQTLGDARIDFQVTTANRHSEAITGVWVQLIELRLPAPPRWRSWGLKRAPWDPPLVMLAAEWGCLTAVSPEAEKALGIEFKPVEERTAKGRKPDGLPRWSLELVAGGGGVVFDDEYATRDVAAGASDTCAVSLRFSPDEQTVLSAGDDVLQAYAVRLPRQLDWPDRRPIARTFLGREPKKEEVFARGRLVAEAKLTLNGNLTREEALAKAPGLADLLPREAAAEARARLFQGRVAGVVNSATVAGSQGVIVWDLEGNTFPHATTWIGDPRCLWWLDPEMDLLADDMFAAFAAAGLRTGLTIRPSLASYIPGKDTVSQVHGYGPLPHGRGVSVVDTYDAKIAYARKRWGCSIFYFDTNLFWRAYGPKDEFQAYPLPGWVFAELQKRHPGCLFVPEFGFNLHYYGLSAPYGQTNMGAWGTPGEARAAYPGAFRFLATEEGNLWNQIDQLVQAGAAGNVFTWFPDQPHSERHMPTLTIGRIAQEGRWAAAVPAEVAAAGPDALAGLLTAARPELRYHAARRLAGAPEAAQAAAAALAARAGDAQEAWGVRRQCLIALRHCPSPAHAALLTGLLKPELHVLWPAAATGLSGQGEAGRTALLAALDAEYAAERERGMMWQAIIPALGASGAAAAPALRQRFAAAKDGDNAYKALLVRQMGRATDAETVAWLIALLQQTANDDIRRACAAALADTGDPEAREILGLALAAARKAKNEGMVEAVEAALRRWR